MTQAATLCSPHLSAPGEALGLISSGHDPTPTREHRGAPQPLSRPWESLAAASTSEDRTLDRHELSTNVQGCRARSPFHPRDMILTVGIKSLQATAGVDLSTTH